MRRLNAGRCGNSHIINAFLKGLAYFAITIAPTTTFSTFLVTHTRGEYIAYRVPEYLIALLLGSFLSSIALCIALALKLTMERGLSLIFSLIMLSATFYYYEDYIVTSRRLTLTVLPYVLKLSNGVHSVFVIDIGQIALTIAAIVGALIVIHIRRIKRT